MPINDVLILAGSLRQGSVSLAAANTLAKQLRDAGLATRILSVEELNLPNFNPDVHTGNPDIARELLQAAREAKAYIWCAPSYHRTISGSFKNVLDFLELLADDKPAYLTGKVVGAVATSKGVVAATNTTIELTMTAHALRAYAIPLMVPIPASHKIVTSDGQLKDAGIQEKLKMLVEEVKNFVRGGVYNTAELEEAI